MNNAIDLNEKTTKFNTIQKPKMAMKINCHESANEVTETTYDCNEGNECILKSLVETNGI